MSSPCKASSSSNSSSCWRLSLSLVHGWYWMVAMIIWGGGDDDDDHHHDRDHDGWWWCYSDDVDDDDDDVDGDAVDDHDDDNLRWGSINFFAALVSSLIATLVSHSLLRLATMVMELLMMMIGGGRGWLFIIFQLLFDNPACETEHLNTSGLLSGCIHGLLSLCSGFLKWISSFTEDHVQP